MSYLLKKKNNTKKILVRWDMFFLAGIFYALDCFQHTAPSVLLLPIAHTMNISIITVGNIMSVYFPFYAFSQIPSGYCIDRFGLANTLSLACVITSIGLLIMTIPSILSLLSGRILIAIGSSCAFIGALKTASMWLPESYFPTAIGMTNTLGIMFGGFFGQPILQLLIHHITWRYAIYSISISGFILALLLKMNLKNKYQTIPVSTMLSKHLLKNMNIYIIAIYAGIMVGVIVNAFSELYDIVFLRSTLHVSVQVAAIISSALFFGIAAGGPIHGLIASKIKIKIWMITGCVLSIFFFLVIVFIHIISSSPILLFILYFLTGFFVSSMLLTFDIVKKITPPSLQGTAFSIVNAIIGLCGFLAQLFLGQSMRIIQTIYHSSTKTAFMVSLSICLIPLLLALYCLIIGIPKQFPKKIK